MGYYVENSNQEPPFTLDNIPDHPDHPDGDLEVYGYFH